MFLDNALKYLRYYISFLYPEYSISVKIWDISILHFFNSYKGRKFVTLGY